MSTPAADQVEVDEDGDMCLPRRHRTCVVYHIRHAMATPLGEVGLQVWSAALLLADFIMSRGSELMGRTILELGAGVGLVSLVAASFAALVFCTDIQDQILANCQQNVQLNSCGDKVRVRWLDWTVPFAYTGEDDFAWKPTELASRIHVILAADVVYIDSMTDAFTECLFHLLRRHQATAYVAVERRINFSLEELDISYKVSVVNS